MNGKVHPSQTENRGTPSLVAKEQNQHRWRQLLRTSAPTRYGRTAPIRSRRDPSGLSSLKETTVKKCSSIKRCLRLIAQLGGFLGRKGDSEPGVKTLWLGLQRFVEFIAGMHAARAELARLMATKPALKNRPAISLRYPDLIRDVDKDVQLMNNGERSLRIEKVENDIWKLCGPV